MADQCRIAQGGGMLFTDDLWRCSTCGQEKYPEVFTCRVDPSRKPRPAGPVAWDVKGERFTSRIEADRHYRKVGGLVTPIFAESKR